MYIVTFFIKKSINRDTRRLIDLLANYTLHHSDLPIILAQTGIYMSIPIRLLFYKCQKTALKHGAAYALERLADRLPETILSDLIRNLEIITRYDKPADAALIDADHMLSLQEEARKGGWAWL